MPSTIDYMDHLRAPAEVESPTPTNDGVRNCNINSKEVLGIGRMRANFHLNLVLWWIGCVFANRYLKHGTIQ